MEIKRIDNQIFALKSEEVKDDLTLHVEKNQGGSQFQAYLVHEFAARIFSLKNFKKCTLNVGQKKWRVVRTSHLSYGERIWNALAHLFGIAIPANSCHLKIYEVKTHLALRMMLCIADFAVRLFTGRSFLNDREAAYYRNLSSLFYSDNDNKEIHLPSQTDYENGVRAISSSSFPTVEDFTKLARRAFHTYESSFLSEDEFASQKCETAFVLHQGVLKLVHQRALLCKDVSLRQKTVDCYLGELKKYYSEAVIEDVAASYGIKLGELGQGIPLTPEVIYHFNHGLAFSKLKLRILRVHDNLYSLETDHVKVKVEVDGALQNAEFQHHLVEEFARKHFKKLSSNLEQFKSCSVTLGSRKWQVMRSNSNSLLRRIIDAINPLVRQKIPEPVRLQICQESRGIFNQTIRFIVDCFARIFTGKTVTQRRDEAYFQPLIPKLHPFHQHSLTISEVQVRLPDTADYAQGVLAYADGPIEAKESEAGFRDPVTTLATWAFQRHERHFANKDNFEPKMCDTVIIWHKDQFKLVRKNCAFLKGKGSKKQIYLETRARYFAYIKKEFGEDRFNHINMEYELGFDRTQPLTPEHVYRFNIGLTILEACQIEQVLQKLKKFKTEMRKHKDKGYLFENIDGQGKQLLPDCQFRKLCAQFGGKPSIAQIDAWIDEQEFCKAAAAEDLTADAFRALMSITDLTKGEKSRALTGREIRQPLAGSYTIADLNASKPWVDQQELLQACSEVEQTQNWPFYYEYLSHVIVKKNLIHRDLSKKTYRSEILIPAPRDGQNRPRWYTVTSFLTNGHGLISYTLENSCKDFKMQTIKLFQSTASSFYALDSSQTVLNDLNPVQSPGYLGMTLSVEKESDFFKARTIPVWVGYLLASEKDWRIRAKASLLIRAFKELKAEVCSPYERKPMKRILREHDYVMSKLLGSYLLHTSYWQAGKLHYRFLKILSKFQKKYLFFTQPDDGVNIPLTRSEVEAIRKDAAELSALLGKMSAKLKPNAAKSQVKAGSSGKGNLAFENEPVSLSAAIAEMRRVLQDHVLTENYQQNLDKASRGEFFDEASKTEYLKAESLQQQIENDLKSVDPSKIQTRLEKNLKQLAGKLESLAKRNKEWPTDKIATDLVFTGHSLGGSAAQVCLVHSLVKNRRIPLRDKTVRGFFFDEPGINDDDNEWFKRFGNKHNELFGRLNIRFRIDQQHETGDVIPLGGETHLGATFSKEEEEAMDWLDFSGKVLERLPTAKDPVIMSSTETHGTRFRQAKKDLDYIEKDFTTLDLGQFNRQGKTDDKDLEKQGLYLKRNIWKLTGYGDDFFFNEKIRTSIIFHPVRWYYARREREEILSSSYKLNIRQYRDQHGLMCVTKKDGLITTLKNMFVPELSP